MKANFNNLKKKFEKNTNIIRVAKNKDNPYVMINKDCINNCNLTWAAKGLHSYLMSLPDDWSIYISELVKHTSSGRDHTYTVVNELLKFGYMEKVQYRYEGKILGLNYTVFETPIDVSNRDNTKALIVNVIVDDNGEIVEKSTCNPLTENTDTVNLDTVSTSLLYNKDKINNNKINNNIDEDDAPKLIELYKNFKLEKRVMPHTIKFLKQNTHISLDVFEQIFINASEDGVVKKYSYIKSIVENLNANNVTTLSDFEKYNDNFRKSKTKKTTKGSSSSKNKFHNTNSTFDKYDPKDLEKGLKESQKDKFPKPNKHEFHNFNEIDKLNVNSGEWGW